MGESGGESSFLRVEAVGKVVKAVKAVKEYRCV
jgi:hypothetical protein